MEEGPLSRVTRHGWKRREHGRDRHDRV